MLLLVKHYHQSLRTKAMSKLTLKINQEDADALEDASNLERNAILFGISEDRLKELNDKLISTINKQMEEFGFESMGQYLKICSSIAENDAEFAMIMFKCGLVEHKIHFMSAMKAGKRVKAEDLLEKARKIINPED